MNPKLKGLAQQAAEIIAARRTIETAAEIPDPNQTEFDAVKGVKGAAGMRN